MKLLVLSADILGFVALFTGAVAVSICSSLLGYLLSGASALIAKILKFSRRLIRLMAKYLEVTRAEKNGTCWYRLRVGNCSLMFGRKQ